MKNRPLKPICNIIGMALVCFPCVVVALESDANQQASFIADHVSFNDNNGTTIYAGHVQMDQGTTHLTADKVVVYKDKDGTMNQSVATGEPAHYTTLPDNQKKAMDAFGDSITYYPQRRIAIIVGNGHIIQGMNSLKGSYIVYDMAKQTVTSMPSAVKEGEKSLIILQPQDMPGK